MKTATTHPEAVALSAPRRVAVRVVETGEVLTYADLAISVNQIARVFKDVGLEAEDTIACLLPNDAHFFQVSWAAKNSGLRYVMLSTKLNEDDLQYILLDSDARALVTSFQFSDRVSNLCETQPLLRQLLVDGDDANDNALMHLARSKEGSPLPDRRRGASMLYSSGTTGRPKGVRAQLDAVPPEQPPARHAGLIQNYGLNERTVFITAAPLYHAGPLRISMAVHRAGGTVVLLKRFDAEVMLAAIQTYGATHAFFVPTMFRRLLDLPAEVRRSYDVSSIRHAIHGAAPCPPDVKRGMIDWWGPVIDEIYGGTESIGQTYISATEWLERPGSVGKPSGSSQIKIVDDQGRSLPAGQIGLVKMRNPQRFQYHGAAARDGKETYDAEGFASLGDIGYLDEDGYLFLTDRLANMIISGGVNVYPQEAELVLAGHEDIDDVAVIGVPDRDLGEVAKALIVLRAGRVASAELAASIHTFCLAKLSKYKCPRSIDFVTELPRGELGKLSKPSIPDDLRAGPGPY